MLKSLPLDGACAGGERAQVGIVHNWMPYEAKRSRAGCLVWWPAVLMRLADRCCERVPPPDMHPGLHVIQEYGLLTLRLR